MRYEKEQIEIFGDAKEVTDETIDAYVQRCKEEGLKMDRFFDNLPHWITDDGDKFQLWMMSDSERESFIEARRPAEITPDSKYFQKTIGYAENAKLVKIGASGIIVR